MALMMNRNVVVTNKKAEKMVIKLFFKGDDDKTEIRRIATEKSVNFDELNVELKERLQIDEPLRLSYTDEDGDSIPILNASDWEACFIDAVRNANKARPRTNDIVVRLNAHVETRDEPDCAPTPIESDAEATPDIAMCGKSARAFNMLFHRVPLEVAAPTKERTIIHKTLDNDVNAEEHKATAEQTLASKETLDAIAAVCGVDASKAIDNMLGFLQELSASEEARALLKNANISLDKLITAHSTPSTMEKEATAPRKRHWATCDACRRTIYDVRHKCADRGCADYDLCDECFETNKTSRAHDHVFYRNEDTSLHGRRLNERAAEYRAQLEKAGEVAKPAPRHSAICDQCRRVIVGARHKCMDVECFDYDLCDTCHTSNVSEQFHAHKFYTTTDASVGGAALRRVVAEERLKTACVQTTEEETTATEEETTANEEAVEATKTEVKPLVSHFGVRCDACYQSVKGIRYKCGNCADFDLCESCEATHTHDDSHVFLKIVKPVQRHRRGVLLAFNLHKNEPRVKKTATSAPATPLTCTKSAPPPPPSPPSPPTQSKAESQSYEAAMRRQLRREETRLMATLSAQQREQQRQYAMMMQQLQARRFELMGGNFAGPFAYDWSPSEPSPPTPPMPFHCFAQPQQYYDYTA